MRTPTIIPVLSSINGEPEEPPIVAPSAHVTCSMTGSCFFLMIINIIINNWQDSRLSPCEPPTGLPHPLFKSRLVNTPGLLVDMGLVRCTLVPPVKIDRSIGELLFNPGYKKNRSGSSAIRTPNPRANRLPDGDPIG